MLDYDAWENVFVNFITIYSFMCLIYTDMWNDFSFSLEAFSAPVFVSGPDRNGFNVGVRRNVQQILGEDRRLWLIPVFTRPVNTALLAFLTPSFNRYVKYFGVLKPRARNIVAYMNSIIEHKIHM